jgi:hypothetical protein
MSRDDDEEKTNLAPEGAGDKPEQRTAPALSQRIGSRLSWAQRAVSPWVRKALGTGRASSPGGHDAAGRRASTALSYSATSRFLRRAQRTVEGSRAWAPDLGTLDPQNVARFTEQVTGRFPGAAKHTVTRLPEEEADHASEFPLPGEAQPARPATEGPVSPMAAGGGTSTMPRMPTSAPWSGTGQVPASEPRPYDGPANASSIAGPSGPGPAVQRAPVRRGPPPRPTREPPTGRLFSRVEEMPARGREGAANEPALPLGANAADASTQPAPSAPASGDNAAPSTEMGRSADLQREPRPVHLSSVEQSTVAPGRRRLPPTEPRPDESATSAIPERTGSLRTPGPSLTTVGEDSPPAPPSPEAPASLRTPGLPSSEAKGSSLAGVDDSLTSPSAGPHATLRPEETPPERGASTAYPGAGAGPDAETGRDPAADRGRANQNLANQAAANPDSPASPGTAQPPVQRAVDAEGAWRVQEHPMEPGTAASTLPRPESDRDLRDEHLEPRRGRAQTDEGVADEPAPGTVQRTRSVHKGAASPQPGSTTPDRSSLAQRGETYAAGQPSTAQERAAVPLPTTQTRQADAPLPDGSRATRESGSTPDEPGTARPSVQAAPIEPDVAGRMQDRDEAAQESPEAARDQHEAMRDWSGSVQRQPDDAQVPRTQSQPPILPEAERPSGPQRAGRPATLGAGEGRSAPRGVEQSHIPPENSHLPAVPAEKRPSAPSGSRRQLIQRQPVRPTQAPSGASEPANPPHTPADEPDQGDRNGGEGASFELPSGIAANQNSRPPLGGGLRERGPESQAVRDPRQGGARRSQGGHSPVDAVQASTADVQSRGTDSSAVQREPVQRASLAGPEERRPSVHEPSAAAHDATVTGSNGTREDTGSSLPLTPGRQVAAQRTAAQRTPAQEDAPDRLPALLLPREAGSRERPAADPRSEPAALPTVRPSRAPGTAQGGATAGLETAGPTRPRTIERSMGTSEGAGPSRVSDRPSGESEAAPGETSMALHLRTTRPVVQTRPVEQTAVLPQVRRSPVPPEGRPHARLEPFASLGGRPGVPRADASEGVRAPLSARLEPGVPIDRKPGVSSPAVQAPVQPVVQPVREPIIQRQPAVPGAAIAVLPAEAGEAADVQRAEVEDEEPGTPTQQEEQDLDRLAREVYPLVKRLLAVERERRTGRWR